MIVWVKFSFLRYHVDTHLWHLFGWFGLLIRSFDFKWANVHISGYSWNNSSCSTSSWCSVLFTCFPCETTIWVPLCPVLVPPLWYDESAYAAAECVFAGKSLSSIDANLFKLLWLSNEKNVYTSINIALKSSD